MPEILDALGSEIAVALAVAGIIALVQRIAMPIIRGWMSKSAELKQNWIFRDTANGQQVGTAKVAQFGNRITIKAMRTIDRDGKPTHRDFTYTGSISDRTLVLKFKQQGAGDGVGGGIVMRLNSDLRTMEGYTSYFSDSAGTVVSRPIYYEAIL